MAEVALTIGTSHMPGLNTPVEHWFTRAESDRRVLESNGYADYDELVRDRSSWIGEQITEERIRERYEACQNALRTLADKLLEVGPDVIVVIGDDHREVFSADHMPSFDVHWAERIYVPPFVGRGDGATIVPDAPGDDNVYPGQSDLAEHMIRVLSDHEFDIAHSRVVGAAGLGHSFDFVCRRIMERRRAPLVPVLLNTYYPPNRPTTGRCYALGRAIRRAIDSWENACRVAVVGTGGLTHHVVDEAMDRSLLNAMAKRDEEALTAYPESRYIDGTSEIKAWIVAAGVMADDERPMTLVDYQPCYRSPAGTGCGNAFAYWQ